MPGLNPAGTANPEDYNLGRGKVSLASLDANDHPIEYRDLGNAAEFNISIETEKLEHQSSREGLKTIDKEVVVSQKMNLAITLDEINFENMALFFSGESGSRSNATAATGVTGSQNLTVTTQGRWIDLYTGVSGKPTTDPQGSRIYDIGTVTITEAGGTSLVEGVDFTVDQIMGRIFVINGGNLIAGTYDLDIAANASAAANVETVKSLTASQVEGALKFISENPASSNVQQEYQFHKVSLAAEGDFSLIGDDWTTMQLTGAAEKNENADPDSPYCTVTTHENA
jgi:hypothetical protein